MTPPAEPHRLAYLGTPALAVPPLHALVEAGFDVGIVVSRPDARRGRGRELSPSPVKRAAMDLGIPVTESVDDLLDVDVDLGVVVAFGRIIKPHILEQLAMVNIHFSLLPRWRGAAPVERALLAGDDHTGVCVMAVEEGLDTGGTYAVSETPIAPDDTLDSLRERLVNLGTDLLVKTLSDGLGEPKEQFGEITYANKLTASDLELDWARSAEELDRIVRLGGAWTTVSGRRLKVHQAELVPDADIPAGALAGAVVGSGRGALRLIEVQPEGKARQDATAWLNGARFGPESRIGS